jgi:cell division protein FtsB
MTLIDEREKNLPKWAQELLNDTRKSAASANEALTRELAALRPRVKLLEAEKGAMMELLQAAARGEHKDAAAIIEVLDGYGLTLTKEDE